MSGGRHFLPLTDAERREMLAAIGAASMEQLFDELPAEVRLKENGLKLPPPLSEMELRAHLGALAAKNMNLQDHPCFLGAGVYDHFIPAVVQHVVGRSEFYTAYTPYQAEISQGLLQSIFEYQTLICRLTGMEAANASLYDGATALAEAALAACSMTRRRKVLVSRSVNPHYRRVLQSYLEGRDCLLLEIPLADGATDFSRLEAMLDGETAALLLQQPNFFGLLEEELEGAAAMAHRHGALLVLSVDPLPGPLPGAGRLLRRHRHRRRACPGQPGLLRRPAAGLLCSPPGAAEAPPRAHRGGDGGWRGPARLRPHTADTRAAHPP